LVLQLLEIGVGVELPLKVLRRDVLRYDGCVVLLGLVTFLYSLDPSDPSQILRFNRVHV
jgi:hypothetical protein